MFTYTKLERLYAKYVGKEYATTVNNGTNALHLALLATGIGKGDEVIVPDFTMAACGFAVSYVGAKVKTVDCDNNLLIDVDRIEERITPKTKAIMPVHIYGRLCNMKRINEIAKKHNLIVIEDACEAQGAEIGNADLTICSFYQNKIIHGEEGGIVLTDNYEYKKRMDKLKNMSFNEKHNYFHNEIGFNMRMPESQAEMIIESLKNVDKNLKKRRKIETWFNEYMPFESRMSKRDTVWVYDFICPNKDKVIPLLPTSRHFFKPLSTMPMWKQKVGKNAKFFSDIGMYFNVDPSMTKREVKKLSKIICQNI